MTKQEFLDELRRMLSGEVSPETIMDSYSYYSTYIEDGMRSGKSEAQVVEELGRPSLIARSIIAAHTGERDVDEIYTEDGKTRRVKNNPFAQNGVFGSKEGKEQNHERTKKEKKPFVFDFTAWYAKVLYALIFILVILILLGLIRIGFWVFVRFGIPILLILGVVYLVMYFLK